MLRDYSIAFAECREAAGAEDPEAQYRLGVMHGLGLGVDQSYPDAVHWYREAAERGHARAQANLGFMYGTGRGVPQDFVFAYAWYNIAAAAGDEMARRNRDVIAERMGPTQLEQAQRLSSELFERIDAKDP